MKAHVGSLVAVKITGLHALRNGSKIVDGSKRTGLLFGHVVEIREIVGSKNIIKTYRVMWDNGNDFQYNEQEMKPYLQNIQDIKNS
jgi:hypothetical protein